MDRAAPEMFQALEASGIGAAIRDATWVYPVANVGHVLSVIVFAGAVAVMDVRLAGAFPQTAAGSVVRAARRFVVGAFIGILLTGFVLFTAEASHLILNPVFQFKLALIALGLINVVGFQLMFARRLEAVPPLAPIPPPVRASAFISLGVWLAVAACGRSIAYF